ncbi:MAG: hypothetical protein ACLT46_05565 [Hungatella sp.]
MKSQTTKNNYQRACRYSYARFALNYYTLYETMCEETGIPAQARTCVETLNKLTEQMLEGSFELEELKRLREQVIGIMEVLTAYSDCFQIYEYVLNRLERKFHEGMKITDSIDEFTEKVGEFLSVSQDSMILNERIQNIIGQLPVRYTKQKFYSMLMDGMSVYTGSEKQTLKDMMYMLRTEAMVLLPEDMKTGYEDLYETLEDLHHADYRNMTAEQYDRCSQKMTYACNKLMDDSGIYMLIQDVINDLYVISLAAPHVVMELGEKQTLEKIISGVLKEFLSGNTSMVEDEVTDLLYELEGTQEDAMERYLSYPGPEETQKGPEEEALRQVDLLLGGSPFVRLEESDRETGEADRTFLEQSVTAFCEELDQTFAALSKPVVRAVMAKILSSLPVVFRFSDEVAEYVRGSLESCTDLAERESCMELIEQVMEIEDVLV